MPVGSVLTLAAAGSETSDSAVLTNEDTMRKVGLNTPLNRPVLAFMNPELTFTVPEKQLVCGISDIIMHTLERYFTKVKEANVFTDRVAEDLIKTVMDASRAAVKNREDYDAMSEIMRCGSVSHSNFTEPRPRQGLLRPQTRPRTQRPLRRDARRLADGTLYFLGQVRLPG